MKKTILGACAFAGMLALASCSNGNCKGNQCGNSNCSDEDMVYTGVLPAADADGVRYTLTLDYDDDDNCMKGDFDLVETNLKCDSVSGKSCDASSSKSEGDFTVIEKDGNKYLKLVKKHQAAAPMCFLVSSDSTLTMVNDSLKVSENPKLNYTLKLVK